MRKQWFGDSRDYVKWSCIRHEAGDTRRVIYAPMLCEDALKGDKLDPNVQDLFNHLKDFAALASLFPAGYTFLDAPYTLRSASTYFDHLETKIHEAQAQGPALVFLDPDTGVEPTGKPNNTHLRKTDLTRTCNLLRPGEKVVVYQHASREKGWQERWYTKLQPIADATGTALSEPFQDTKTCKDVCFFTFTKR